VALHALLVDVNAQVTARGIQRRPIEGVIYDAERGHRAESMASSRRRSP
jgi:hypothetical protein